MRRRQVPLRTPRSVAVLLIALSLAACDSSVPVSDAAVPGTTGAITRTSPDFLEFAGGDIFGDVAAGGGSVWVATLEGLIEVDPESLAAAWHTDLAPGKKIVYAFDSLWVSDETSVRRVDPRTLEVVATIPAKLPEGLDADADGIWVSQHRDGTLVRIDPASNAVAETVTVSETDGWPMGPAVVDEEVWVAMGNAAEVVRVEADGDVVAIGVPRAVLSPAMGTAEAIWFTDGVNVAITRIDRATGDVTVVEVPPSVLEPRYGVGAGINIRGRPWFPTAGGAMIAVDPVTAEVVGTVPLSGSIPRNAIEHEQAVWVMNEEGGSLERIPIDRFTTS